MDIVALKVYGAVAIFFVALAAAYIPYAKKLSSTKAVDFPVGESIAAGVFFGAGMLHMLPDAQEGFEALGIGYPFAFLLASITFLLLLFFEHLSENIETKSENKFVYLSLIIFSIHSFLAGASVGVSDKITTTIIVFLAIAAHKWAAAFTIAVQITKSSLSTSLGLVLFLLFALMVPSGILAGDEALMHLKHVPWLEPVFLSLAAGTFVYLGTLHDFQNAVMIERCRSHKLFWFMLLGFAIMALAAVWV